MYCPNRISAAYPLTTSFETSKIGSMRAHDLNRVTLFLPSFPDACVTSVKAFLILNHILSGNHDHMSVNILSKGSVMDCALFSGELKPDLTVEATD
jgi:hypothetical protein